MAKLTRAQTQTVQSALYHAKRARDYLDQPDVAVGRLGGTATTTLHFTRLDGAVFYKVDKHIGSDITGLDDCIRALRTLIAD